MSSEILHKISCYSSLVAVRFIVEVYHVALRIQLGFISAVVFDSIDMWEGLHAKLAVESPAKGVEDLIFLLCTVPDIPLMHVCQNI